MQRAAAVVAKRPVRLPDGAGVVVPAGDDAVAVAARAPPLGGRMHVGGSAPPTLQHRCLPQSQVVVLH